MRKAQRRLACLGPSAGPPSSSGERRPWPWPSSFLDPEQPGHPAPTRPVSRVRVMGGWQSPSRQLCRAPGNRASGQRHATQLGQELRRIRLGVSLASGDDLPPSPGSVGAGGLGAPSRVRTTYRPLHIPRTGPPPPEPHFGGRPGSECAGSPSSELSSEPRCPTEGLAV